MILSLISIIIMTYTLPLLMGRLIIKLFSKNTISYPFVSYFVTGVLFLYVILLILNSAIFPLFPNVVFIDAFKGVLSLLISVAIVGNFFLPKKDLNFKKYLFPAFFSSFLAIGIYFLWQLHSPFSLNWDIYEHQTLINNILAGRFSFFSSQISDTFGFNSYPTLFHSLIAASQAFIPLNLTNYWHMASLIHFSLVIFASYLLAKEITGNKKIALISGFLGGIIFDSTVSFTSFFLLPQTFTAVFFIFLFIQLLSSIKDKKTLPFSLIIIGGIFLILNHYLIGAVAFAIYLLTYLCFRYRNLIHLKVNKKIIIAIFSLLAILAVAFSSKLQLNFLNRGEAQFFNYSLSEKFNFMRQSYGFLILAFLPIGIFSILKKRKELEIFTLFITLSILTVILLQIPYVLKFYTLGRFFVHVLIAIGIYTLLKQVKNTILYYLAIISLVSILTGILISNSVYWKYYLSYNGTFASLSNNELQAASFLKNQYQGENVLLVSDPSTQNILEPFSLINTQGGAYMSSYSRSILDEISKTNDTAEIANKIYKINDSLIPEGTRLFAVSGRYFLWQSSSENDKKSISYNIWSPADLTLEDNMLIDKLKSDTSHFSLVFSNPSIAIFEVNK